MYLKKLSVAKCTTFDRPAHGNIQYGLLRILEYLRVSKSYHNRKLKYSSSNSTPTVRYALFME